MGFILYFLRLYLHCHILRFAFSPCDMRAESPLFRSSFAPRHGSLCLITYGTSRKTPVRKVSWNLFFCVQQTLKKIKNFSVIRVDCWQRNADLLTCTLKVKQDFIFLNACKSFSTINGDTVSSSKCSPSRPAVYLFNLKVIGNGLKQKRFSTVVITVCQI